MSGGTMAGARSAAPALVARGASSFRGILRRPVGSPASLVEWARLESGFPVARATSPDASLTGFLAASRRELARELRSAGVVLLRGFGVRDLAEFERAVRAEGGPPMSYDYASTPRTGLGGGVFTATEYPADQTIPLHNEMSYAPSWPSLVWFHCRRPAVTGGATPLADARRVERAISPSVRERFARHGVLYVRNHGGGLDLPLSAVFGTTDRDAIEAFCRRAGIAWRWRSDGGLRTWRVGPATTSHPQTGETCWFNQAHLFHPSRLEPEVRAALETGMAPDELPRNAFYGDGSPIEDQVLDEVRAAYRGETRRFDWQAGDVAIVDNVLLAHGRDPFAGRRDVVVAMTRAGMLDVLDEG